MGTKKYQNTIKKLIKYSDCKSNVIPLPPFMDFNTQLIFLFSALGALNGLFLSVYFAFFTKRYKKSNYFLAALLFVLSIRIIKSVFFYFNPHLSEIFIQIGISACALIGPFLYLYTKSLMAENKGSRWLLHILPISLIVSVLGVIYPYLSYHILWSKFIVPAIHLVWLLYIIMAGIQLKVVFKNFFSRDITLKNIEVWMLSIYLGVAIIWLGYIIGSYTSYIVGALSFSFVFYLVILFWILKRKKKNLFFEDNIKYADRKIDFEEAKSIASDLYIAMQEKKLFENPNLKLADVAKELNIQPHNLSQYLNDNLEKSFALFLNEYRIEAAKVLLLKNKEYTTEAIGYECGFNSKSTFHSSFKKIAGSTPANYRNNKV